MDDELSIMNKRSIFDTLLCLIGVSVVVGGTAASVARQLPLEAPWLLQAKTDEERRARSQEVRPFTIEPHYKSLAVAANDRC
jgi:hypothetical protein